MVLDLEGRRIWISEWRRRRVCAPSIGETGSAPCIIAVWTGKARAAVAPAQELLQGGVIGVGDRYTLHFSTNYFSLLQC